jgi:hypothetical protein
VRRFLFILALCVVLAFERSDAAVTGPLEYSVSFAETAYNPADSTTYYFGTLESVGPNTTQSIAKIRFGHSGRIIKAYLDVFILTTNGTAENSTLSLRLNATTDTTVSATVVHNGGLGSSAVFSNLALDIPFIASDVFEAKIVTPAFSTNPQGIIYTLTLVVAQAGR